MTPAAGSLAERVARQLGIDAARVSGSGPDGGAALADVMRAAGRSLPAAARPRPPVPAAPPRRGFRLLETYCGSRWLRAAREALNEVEPTEELAICVRLCASALETSPPPELGAEEREPDPVDMLIADRRAVVLHGVQGLGVSAIRDTLRTAPEFSGEVPPAFTVRTPEAPDAEGGLDASRAVLRFEVGEDSIRLALEYAEGLASDEWGEAFLARLRALCIDPRRALL